MVVIVGVRWIYSLVIREGIRVPVPFRTAGISQRRRGARLCVGAKSTNMVSWSRFVLGRGRSRIVVADVVSLKIRFTLEHIIRRMLRKDACLLDHQDFMRERLTLRKVTLTALPPRKAPSSVRAASSASTGVAYAIKLQEDSIRQ